MIDVATISSIFERMRKGLNFIEGAEKREVIRCLRSMYFYPDRILSSLRQIIENDGFGYEDAINDAIPFMPDAMEAQKAIDFVSTGSVQSNLSISLKDLDELRAVADFKTGVRSLLHSIFLIAAIKRDRQLILKLAKEAYEDITYLNKQIEQLERSLNT